MSPMNSNKFMILFHKHITNINRTLKNIKSDIIANFIQTDHKGSQLLLTKLHPC